MEKSTKIILTLTAVAMLTAIIVIRKRKKDEEKSNAHGHYGGGGGGHRPRGGIRNIYGGSYVFPYTPLYGYDQCTYTDKNGLLVAAPCRDGWSRAW
jgi:hypothetical protein